MITIVVPIFNEEENIAPLIDEIIAVSKIIPISEILYVDDGSDDESLAILQRLKEQHNTLRVISHRKCCGQSAALWTGIKAAGNDLIVTLDGDGQNDPADIALLYQTYLDHKTSWPRIMIAGQRKKRNDSWAKRISSRLANHIRSRILKDNTRDTGCSLKLFRRKDYLCLPYFDHMHRFLPALMKRDNVRVVHTDVSHRPRTHGKSKYGTFDRLAVGVGDLWGVWWLLQRPFDYPETFEDLSEKT